MKIEHFFSELKRRNVLKIALVYGVVSWLLIEVAWILLPILTRPSGCRRLLSYSSHSASAFTLNTGGYLDCAFED
jgi:hypothetical protein